MRLGIRGHDFQKSEDFDLAKNLVDFGLDGVQLVPYKTYSDIPYSPSLTVSRAKEIASELSNSQKQVFLLGAYFNPVHSNSEKVETSIKTFKRYIELASVFQTDVVGSETGSFNDDKWTYNPLNRTDSALDTVIETFKDLCAYAKKFDVCVGIEGASGHVCFSPQRLKQAVDAIGFDNLKIIFDIYNYLDDENYQRYLDILAEGLDIFNGRIHCFHIKDCKIIDGKLKQCAVGSGMFDFHRILGLIKSKNSNPVLILEGTTGDDILPSITFLKDVWSKL